MLIVQPYKTTTIPNAEVGELIAFTEEHGGEFGIILARQAEYDQSFLAVFPSDGSAPHVSMVRGDADCVSYGSSWVFDVEQSRSFPVNSGDSLKSGLACIQGEDVFLRFGRNPQDIRSHGGGYLDMRSMTFRPLSGFAVYTSSWKIWASEAERTRRVGTHLLSGS